MLSDNSAAHVGEQLDRLFTTTQRYLQTLKRLEHDNRANFRVRAALEKKKNPSASLTSEDEALISGKSDQTFIDEWARIGHERHGIADKVRPDLWREVFDCIDDLEEVDFPRARNLRRDFQKLRDEVPEGKESAEWVIDFLVGLNTLLRDAQADLLQSQASPRSDEKRNPETSGQPTPRSFSAEYAAAKLADFMARNGLDQTSLHERMGGKVSTKTISKLLNKKVATSRVLEDIAGTMGITKEKLLSSE